MMLLRASSVLRRKLCPGSANLERGLPEEDSEIAAEGTLLHSLDADPCIDRSKLKPHQRDLLAISERLTKEAFTRIGGQFGVGDATPTAGGFEREMFLHRRIKSLFSGHCDVWEYFSDAKLLVLVEKKFGYLSVDPASSNMQTRTYACMGAEIYDCDHVAVAITQPRLPVDQRTTLAVYNRDEIQAARTQLFDIWDACNDENAPLHASESACRYCRAKLLCPAYRETVTAGLAIVPAINGLTKTAREVAIEERIKQASDVDLQKMFEAVHLAGFVKEPLFEEMRARIRDGQMPGYKLGKESEVREITDVGAAVDRLVTAGLPKEKIMAACRISLGDDGGVAGVYRDAKGTTWKETRDNVNDILGDLIERKPKKPSIEKVSNRKTLE